MGKNLKSISPFLIIILSLSCILFLPLSIFINEHGSIYAQEDAVKMRISIILVKTKPAAQKILKKLDAGDNFAELAMQFSTGPGKEEGGDLGYFAQEDLMEDLKTTAMNLKIGEYSGIVETRQGYFILMKTDEKTSSKLAVAQAKEDLWKELDTNATRLYHEGRYPEAVKVANEALNVAEKTFGTNHPSFAASMNNLAELYQAQGKYTEAEPL